MTPEARGYTEQFFNGMFLASRIEVYALDIMFGIKQFMQEYL